MWRTRLDEFNCDLYTFVINVFLNVKRVKVFKTVLQSGYDGDDLAGFQEVSDTWIYSNSV